MKKIITLLFGFTLLGTVQIASAAFDLNNMSGTVKKLSTCDNDTAVGYVLVWLEDDMGNVASFAAGSATADADEAQVRKNIFSTVLAAYLAKEQIEVMYTAGTGTVCEVTFDHVLRGVSIGAL